MRWFSGIYRALIPIHSLKFYSVRGALEVCLDDVPVGKAVIEKGQKETHRSLIQLHHVPNLPRKEAGYEPGKAKDTYQVTHLIDRILTNKYVGFPIFEI